MKLTLEYTLPEENQDYEVAMNGSKYLGVLQELDNYLRSQLKYTQLTDEQFLVTEAIRSKLYELLNDTGVTIDG